MALLAVLDVEDVATEKIKRVKNALDDLVSSAKRSAQAVQQAQSGGSGGGLANTNDQLARLIELSEKANVSLTKVVDGINKLGQAQQQNQNQNQSTQSWLQGVSIQAAGLALALNKLGADMRSLLEESARLAARVETLGVVTQITAKNAGYTTAELTGQVAAIKKLGITTEEATDSVLQFVRSNLNLADAAKLARVSQDLAVVAGKNSSQTYETLTRAIQTSETMLLRQFGIVTTNEQLWATYARTIGKTVTQLTQQEKQQAFVNRIMEEGTKVAGSYESSMETAGKQLTSMARLTEELHLKLGQALLPTFTLIVHAIYELLNVLNKFGPEFFKVVAALAAGVTAMTTFATAVTGAIAVWGAFSAVLGAALGPVGAIAAAIGVLAAALVYLNSHAEVSVQALGEQAAALDEQQRATVAAYEKYVELTAQGVKLTDSTEKQTDAQKDLRKSIEELAKTVPSAITEVDNLTHSYRFNLDEVVRVINANEELRQSYQRSAEAQLLASQRELGHLAQDKAAATRDVNRARQNLADAEKSLRETEATIAAERSKGSTGPFENTARISRLKSAKDAVRSAEDALISYAAVLTDLDRKERVLNVTIANTERTLAEISKNVPTQMQDIQKGVLGDIAAFEKRAKAVNVSLSALTDPKNLGDMGKYRQIVNGLLQDVIKAEDKQMKERAKYTQAFDAALNNIRGTGVATRAQLDAVDKGLGEVSAGTEEWQDRVRRASQAIGLFNKASASTQENLKNLAVAAQYLKDIDLAKWASGVGANFDKMILSLTEAQGKLAKGLTDEISQLGIKQADEAYEARKSSAEKIEDLDREVADKRAEMYLDSTDLAIYQERRRVEEIERATEREIAARAHAQQKAEEAFEERVRQIKSEAIELKRNIDIQIEQRARQAEEEIKFQEIEGRLTAEDAANKLGILADLRKEYLRDAQEQHDLRMADIEERAALGRTVVQQGRQLNDQLAKDQRASVDRQKQYSAEVVQTIKRDQSVIYQIMRDVSVNLASSISKGFLDILTQARSTKDAFIGIVRSMADTVLNIINDMVSKWIRRAAVLATSGGGFDIGTFFRALMGAGGGGGMQSVAQLTGGYAQLGMQAGQLTMTGAGAAGAAGAGGGGAGAALAGGLVAGVGGYYTGALAASKFGGENYLQSAGVGFGTGAAAGATIGSVVPGIGTGVGALVGGIAGAIGGWLQERKRRKELMAERDKIISEMGGLDEFKRKAEEAGVALDKFLSTKKSKEYALELQKIQKAFVNLDRTKFIESQGGLDALIEKAQRAGIELSEGFKRGESTAADMAKELEKVQKALALQEAKDGLARTVTQMDELRKRAVLVGYDLKKLYDAKTIEEFNNEQAKLNKLLEEQQRRLQGLSVAAAGIQARVQGLRQSVDRGATPEAVQRAVDTIGKSIGTVFGGILRETGDVAQAFAAVSGSLDELQKILDETGATADRSLTHLLQFRRTVLDNQDVANSLAGITQILKGLSDAGRLTADMFNSLGADAAAQWQTLMDRGVAADQALLLMQPTLQALYEAQKNFGFATDEATQKLIEMGVTNGIVGDQFQSVNQKMLDILVLIAETLGADIPEAYRRQQAAAEAAAGAGASAAQDQADAAQDAAEQQQNAAEAAEQAGTKVGDLTDEVVNYQDYVNRQEWRKPYHEVEVAVEGVETGLGDATTAVKTFADTAVTELERVAAAASAISLGHSPGGLKEIPLKTRDALSAFAALRMHADRDLGAVEDQVNAMNRAMDARMQGGSEDTAPRRRTRGVDAERTDEGTTVVVNMGGVSVTLSGDEEGVKKGWASIRGDFLRELENNSHQTASRVAAASRRYSR